MLHVSGATEMRNSMSPFQSDPTRAASRRHHSRDLVVAVPSMVPPLLRVGVLTTPPRWQSCAVGRVRGEAVPVAPSKASAVLQVNGR